MSNRTCQLIPHLFVWQPQSPIQKQPFNKVHFCHCYPVLYENVILPETGYCSAWSDHGVLLNGQQTTEVIGSISASYEQTSAGPGSRLLLSRPILLLLLLSHHAPALCSRLSSSHLLASVLLIASGRCCRLIVVGTGWLCVSSVNIRSLLVCR